MTKRCLDNNERLKIAFDNDLNGSADLYGGPAVTDHASFYFSLAIRLLLLSEESDCSDKEI
jgi:hypothetical protein